jgi:excisionase family DNA binding protein
MTTTNFSEKVSPLQAGWPTVAQAAMTYGIPEVTMRQDVRQGHVKARRIGPRLVRVDPEDLERFMAGEPVFQPDDDGPEAA